MNEVWVDLPCGHDFEPDFQTGERLVWCEECGTPTVVVAYEIKVIEYMMHPPKFIPPREPLI